MKFFDKAIGDNIDAAMKAVSETLSLSVGKRGVGTPGSPTQKQVLIRATEKDHNRWKQAAKIKGISLAEMVRELCNKAAAEALDCQHEAPFLKVYPWATICTKCSQRLSQVG